MAKTLTCTLALALTVTLTSAPAAMADDVPFVKKLLEAAERGKAVIRYNQATNGRIPAGVTGYTGRTAPGVEADGTGIRG